MKPEYAATAFFEALAKVHGWQTMSVTDAAQAVQHSDAPEAYASWEPLARALAIAATGETGAGLACEFSLPRSPEAPPSPVPALTKQLGAPTLGTRVSGTRGWIVATWLVAHAEQYRITSVRYGGQEWTPDGRWRAVHASGPGVQILQAEAGQ
jgi:hypothetical protein